MSKKIKNHKLFPYFSVLIATITSMTMITFYNYPSLASVDRPVQIKTRNSNGLVNIRNGPGISYKIITVIPNNTIVLICTQCEESQEKKDKNGDIWYHVWWEKKGLSGWVHGNYLKQNINY